MFVIERKLINASITALVGGALTFFGFMHGEAIGIAQTPLVALSYLGVAGVLLGCAKFAVTSPAPLAAAHEHHPLPEPRESSLSGPTPFRR